MDKVKAQLAVALKYGFWIGSALILISSLVVWYMSTSTLAQETESESSRLEGVIKKISSVKRAMPELPNESSHEVMNEMIKQRQDEVLQSWQTLFDRQKPYLTWPKDELGDEFVALFEGKIPIEQYIDFPNTEEHSAFFLNLYRDHIIKEPAKLARIAGAIWTVSDGKNSSGLSTLGGGNEVEETPVVAWSTTSQKSLDNEIFRWHGDTPTTLECYYSQESQWILKQLMMIIKEVNGDATQPYQAKIREIEEIHIGPSVNFSVGEYSSIQGSGSMTNLGDTASGGQLGGGGGGGGGGLGLGRMDSGGGLGGGSSGPTTDPAERRYVDKNLKHIAASALRTALKSNKPSDASLAVAKRVPIMMSLKMDQRTVHELLAACGSADLMVEVTQVRILEGSGSGKPSSSKISGGGGGLSSLGGGGSSKSSSSSGSSAVDEYPFDVNVQLYGMIYIYNTPDPNKLPVEQVTEETLDEALGETPVTETPETETPPAGDESLPQDNEVLQPPADGAEPQPSDAVAVPTDGGQPAEDPVPAEPAPATP